MVLMERSIRTDRTSGLPVTQHTDYRGHSHHFYFTNPGWIDNGRRLLFSSDRANRTNLYALDLESGSIEQITDLEPVPLPRELEFVRAAVNPVTDEAYFFHDRSLLGIDPTTKRSRLIAELAPGYVVSQLNVTADGLSIVYSEHEDLSDTIETDFLRGYVGFPETWAAKPHSRVTRAAVDGSGTRVVFEEDYWIGHANTSPANPAHATFCHEGPWDRVDHRIWGLDLVTGRAHRIRPTRPGETIGHEYWYADGERIGYHGRLADGRSVFGRCRLDGSDRYEHAMSGVTGHTFSLDERVIVGDGGGVIRAWQWTDEGYDGPRVLCEHRSSSKIQQLHPHPRIDPTGSYVVFTSDVTGYGNVYTVPLPDDIRSLPMAPDS